MITARQQGGRDYRYFWSGSLDGSPPPHVACYWGISTDVNGWREVSLSGGKVHFLVRGSVWCICARGWRDPLSMSPSSHSKQSHDSLSVIPARVHQKECISSLRWPEYGGAPSQHWLPQIFSDFPSLYLLLCLCRYSSRNWWCFRQYISIWATVWFAPSSLRWTFCWFRSFFTKGRKSLRPIFPIRIWNKFDARIRRSPVYFLEWWLVSCGVVVDVDVSRVFCCPSAYPIFALQKVFNVEKSRSWSGWSE